MQNLFYDTRALDAGARNSFGLSEELMMENAASGLEKAVLDYFENHTESSIYIARPAILILCGAGNNGADGYALARKLDGHRFNITAFQMTEPKTELCRLQMERAKKSGVSFISLYDLDEYLERISIDLKVVVDCIFGSGFHGSIPYEARAVFDQINKNRDCFRIACDIPSGLDLDGNADSRTFMAHQTVTMGALKSCLYSDQAKDLCGKISLVNLGISRTAFEEGYDPEGKKIVSVGRLLEESDMELPSRSRQNVNKGSFGHGAVVAGNKAGAAVLAGSGCFGFGAGLVTLVGNVECGQKITLAGFGQCATTQSASENSGTQSTISAIVPFELVCSTSFPSKTSAVAMGMGLGRPEDGDVVRKISELGFDFISSHQEIPCVLDADAFYWSQTADLISKRRGTVSSIKTVLTPHPKEFAEFLKICGLGEYSVEEVCLKKIELAQKFCQAYPGIVLLLKGASVIICRYDEENKINLLVNPLGTNALAKGGSGDVLSGMILALLCQNQNGMMACKNASLAHALASRRMENSFAMTPWNLMEAVSKLGQN